MHPRNPTSSQVRERGTILALTAIMLIGLIIMAAFAIDVGVWYNSATEGQRAADIASLAAVEEYSRVFEATSGTAQQKHDAAVIAATAMAQSLVAENGYDPALMTIQLDSNPPPPAVPNGSIRINVGVTDADVETFFAGVVIDNIDIQRDATAELNDCVADCTVDIPVVSGFQSMIDAGTGGDGWRPTITDNGQVFNMFHHHSGDLFQCVDTSVQPAVICPGASYPLDPYPGLNMETNYTPKLAAVGNKVYFVVQTSNRTGLGCWDGDTHSQCAGFVGNPVWIGFFDFADTSFYGTRVDGPEVVYTSSGNVQSNHRLFLFGDNGQVYCYSPTGAACTGYPKASALTGNHLLTPDGTFQNGLLDQDEMQFDMAPTMDLTKIFLSQQPTPNGTSVTCWDVTTDATCAGFNTTNTAAGRVYLFPSYDQTLFVPQVTGVCARGGDHGGGNIGYGCFDMNGAPVDRMMVDDGFGNDVKAFTFDNNRPTQQSATGISTDGHYRTFFPFRDLDGYKCWDWTTDSLCAIAAANWTESTEDYAYIYDGSRCMYGLGHAGLAWSFDVDTGQFPCPADGVAQKVIDACRCADGSPRWTSLILSSETDLSVFQEFTIEVLFLDGTPFTSVDMTTAAFPELDLRPLNNLGSPPLQMRVRVTAIEKAAFQGVALNTWTDISVIQVDGILPTLVD